MCISPYIHKYVDALGRDQVVSLNCGKCLECVISKQNAYKVRLIEESRQWSRCYFFTLTYRPRSLPYNVVTDFDEVIGVCRGSRKHEISETFRTLSSGRVKDIQDWLMRFRVHFARKEGAKQGISKRDCTGALFGLLKPDFKYFICCEYGPRGTHRPHYHGIIFTDLDYAQVSPLIDDWKTRYGYVHFKEVMYRADSQNRISAPANYVSKYCCKGEFASRVHDIELRLIEPAFILQSHGIGASYADEFRHVHIPPGTHASNPEQVSKVCDRLFYMDGSFKYAIPRYIYNRLFLKKVPRLVERYNCKKHCYEIKTTYVYLQTPLSLAMSDELRSRAKLRDNQRTRQFEFDYKDKSFSEVVLCVNSTAEGEQMARQEVASNRLGSFYAAQAVKYNL